MTFIFEVFFSGCISKIINDGKDYLWPKIKRAINDKNDQNVSTKIYRVMEKSLNIVTNEKFRNTDKLYNAIEKIFFEFKNRGNTIESVKCGLDILGTDVSNQRCENFLEKFYAGICQDDDLYKTISLILLQKGIKFNQKEFQKVSEKVDKNHVELIEKIGSINENLNRSSWIQEGNITEKKIMFQNNKKQDYIKNWNSRMFLHVGDDENPITLADAFIMPDYIEHNDQYSFCGKESLEQRIHNFMSRLNKSSIMLITGVPGIGKSAITSWIANMYKDYDAVIILRFRDWDREDLEKGLLKAICNTLECKKIDLNYKILILDGFDELKSLEIREKILAIFLNDILDIKNLKCIITSRPAYINIDYFESVLELQVFDKSRVQAFFKKIKNIELDERDIISENLKVLGVPVILYMAIMSNIDITGNATKPELYNRIFSGKGGIFDRFYYEGTAYDEGSHPLRNSENIKKYLEFLQEVAFRMYKKNNLSLLIEKCQVPELEFQGKPIKVLEFPIKHLFENIESNLEFIHKSIYEYFVSEYILTKILKYIRKENVEALAGELGKVLKYNVLDDEIAEYLSYRISLRNSTSMNTYDILKMPSSPKSIGVLINAFSIMLKNGMTYYSKEICKNNIKCELNVFSSIVRIFEHCLNSKNKLCIEYKEEFLSYLSHQYLRSGEVHLLYINLSEINLENISLKKSFFKEIDLKKSKFDSVNMTEVRFINTDLSETEFIGVNLENAVFENVNLKGAKFRNCKLKNVKFVESELIIELVNVDLEGTKFIQSNIHFVDLSYSNIKYIELFKSEISYNTANIFNNAIIDIRTMLMVEKVFGNKVHDCKIDMCDNILSYEEYMIFREQKLTELQKEILEVFETGKNYDNI